MKSDLKFSIKQKCKSFLKTPYTILIVEQSVLGHLTVLRFETTVCTLSIRTNVVKTSQRKQKIAFGPSRKRISTEKYFKYLE